MATLPYHRFVEYIEQIKQFSDNLYDEWMIAGTSDEDYSKYIFKKRMKLLETSVVVFEYHVVYSVSYEVPLLCLNIQREDGSLLHLEEIKGCLGISGNVLSILTQMDHPVLQRPFYTLHPCRTSEIMQQFPKSKNPVVSWLSAIGATVHLEIPNDYATLTFE